MSTQLKCDHCKAVKAEGLKARLMYLASGNTQADLKYVAEFKVDLCDSCQDKLVTAMQNFLKVKPTVPEVK